MLIAAPPRPAPSVPAPPGAVLVVEAPCRHRRHGRRGGPAGAGARRPPVEPRRRRAARAARQRRSSPERPATGAGADHRRRPQRRPGSQRTGGARPRRVDRRLGRGPRRLTTSGRRTGRPANAPAVRRRSASTTCSLLPARSCGACAVAIDHERLDRAAGLSDHLPVAATVRAAVNEAMRRQGAQAARQGRGDRQRERGRRVLGQGRPAHRRPSHRPVAARGRARRRRPAGPATSADRPRRVRARRDWPCSAPSPPPTTASSSGSRDPTGRRRCSPASSPTSMPRSCSTSRCTCRPPGRWPPCGGRPRPRRSAGGGRSSSASPPASASCSRRPSTGRGRRPVDGHRGCRTFGRGRRACVTTRRPRSVASSPPARRAQRWPAGGTADGAPRRQPTSGVAVSPGGGRSDRHDDDSIMTTEAVYAAEDAAFGGTDFDDELDSRRVDELVAGITGGEWWRSCGVADSRASSRHGQARARHPPARQATGLCRRSASPRRRRRRCPTSSPMPWPGSTAVTTRRSAPPTSTSSPCSPARSSPPACGQAYRDYGVPIGRRRWPPPVRVRGPGFVMT